MRLPLVVMSLLCQVIRMGSGALQRHSARRDAPEDCRGCLECSRDNGCVRCPERLFLFLRRDGASHHGSCLHACPAGHYGQRGKDVSRCMKCRSLDCQHCFSRDFCTRCRAGLVLHRGKCLSRCPDGTFVHHADCLEDCIVAPPAEWTEWSACLRDGVPCGFRWGRQTRTRGAGQSGKAPEEEAPVCPSQNQIQIQRCRMRKKCPAERRQTPTAGRGRKRERKRQRLLATAATDKSSNGTTDATAGGERRDAGEDSGVSDTSRFTLNI